MPGGLPSFGLPDVDWSTEARAVAATTFSIFTNVDAALRAQLDRYGVTELVGESAYYDTVSAVVGDLART